jgi:hypothetical protein
MLNWLKGEKTVPASGDDRPIRFVKIAENIWRVEYADVTA